MEASQLSVTDPSEIPAEAGTIASAWHAVFARSQSADREAIDPLQRWLETQANPHAAVLSGRPAAGPANEQSARQLEALMLARYPSRELSLTTIAQQLLLLHRIGNRLRNDGLELAPTWISGILRPHPSPFPPDTAQALAKVELWKRGLEQLILDGHAAAGPKVLWPAIMLSSIMNGALLDRAKLVRLRVLLAKHGKQSLSATSGEEHAFVEFLLPFEGLGNHHLQRWYIDPVTELLLGGVPGAQALPSFKETHLLMRDALRLGNVPWDKLPASISDLLHCAGVWWAVRGAPVDLHAMNRTFAAHDLTTRCWSRVQGWAQPPESGAPSGVGGGALRISASAETEAELFDAASAEHDWLPEVRALLEGATLADSIDAVGRYFDTIDDLDYRKPYIGWLRHALTTKPKNADMAPKLPVLKLPFLFAAPRLLNYLGERQPQLLAVDELDETYRVILDGCDPHEPVERIARGLRLFHDYLVKQHGRAQLPNPRKTFGEGGSLMPVDATMITVDEYLRAQDWLEKQLEVGADRVDTMVCRLVLTLAFRVGLRRGEIFGLRLRDVHDQGGMYLQVRRYGQHTLKTANATRTLRIDALLSTRERRWLREWITRRQAEESLLSDPGRNTGHSPLLFARPGAGMAAVSIDGVVQRTMHAIHAVTAEPRLHLHHLRHSCGTWLWLKLRAPDYPELRAMLGAMPGLCSELQTARRLRVFLCGAASGPSRGYTYVVARILGHSSPATTLAHYLHVDDLFRAATMHRAAADTPVEVWHALTGARRSTLYEWLQGGTHGVVVGARAYAAGAASEKDKMAAPAGATAERFSGTTSPWRRPISTPPVRFGGDGLIACASRVLHLYNRLDPDLHHEARVQAVATQCELPQSQVTEWICNARTLGSAFNIKCPSGTGLGDSPHDAMLVPAPPVELHVDEVQSIRYLADCLEGAFDASPDLMHRALALVPARFNRRRNDVVFRGPVDEKAIRLFLKALRIAGLSSDRLQLVVRRVRADDTKLPSWFRAARGEDVIVKRVPPPGTTHKQAKAYARWVGVQMRAADAGTQGNAWRICLFLACVAFGNRETAGAERPDQPR